MKQIESSRMSWILSDVINMHGEAGLRSRCDEWYDGEMESIYPNVHPEGRLPAAVAGPGCGELRYMRFRRQLVEGHRAGDHRGRTDSVADGHADAGRTDRTDNTQYIAGSRSTIAQCVGQTDERSLQCDGSARCGTSRLLSANRAAAIASGGGAISRGQNS